MAIEPTYKKENPIKKNIKEPAMTIEPEVDLSKSSIDREKLLQELM